MQDVTMLRRYALRTAYLLNFLGLGATAWPAVISPSRPMGLVDGAAFAFWAAFAALAGLGVRYPLQMLPLLLLQLSYKTVWFLAVALPLRSAGAWNASATGLARTFALAMAVDLLVIPWGYVWLHYVKQPGDAWRP